MTEEFARARNIGELARKVDMSREGLQEALSGAVDPSFATILSWGEWHLVKP